MIISAEANDRLALPSDGPRLELKQWRAKPSLAPEFQFVIDRIKSLAAGDLTSMHVVGDFLKRRIAPLQKTLEDLQAEQRAGVERIAAWAGEASTALVPLGVSPIPVSEPPTSISDALPVLDSTADRLRRLDQILGARLEAEGGRLCRAVIE